jgi:hypothetical protein
MKIRKSKLWFCFTCSLIVFNANEHPDWFKYQQTSLTFHVTGLRGSIGGGGIDRISDDDCWTSIFGTDTFKDWDFGKRLRFLLVLLGGGAQLLFEDKTFNVTGGDKERFFFAIRKRLDSKQRNY